MKAYLSGPMAGYANHNFEAFERTTRVLRDQGHVIVSPHEVAVADGSVVGDESVNPGTKRYSDYLRADLVEMVGVDGLDSLVLLPGWASSSGAWIELTIARALGWAIFYCDVKYILHLVSKP